MLYSNLTVMLIKCVISASSHFTCSSPKQLVGKHLRLFYSFYQNDFQKAIKGLLRVVKNKRLAMNHLRVSAVMESAYNHC